MSNIGFIGLGIMGKPMAANLIKGGHTLYLHSRSGVPQELTAAGGKASASAKEVAQKSDIVITMVPDTPDVEKVLFGAGFGGEYQCFADRFEIQRDDDLVAYLARLPVAVAADQRDVLAHLLEHRLNLVERGLRAADHDGERGVLCTDFAAGHRRIEIFAS